MAEGEAERERGAAALREELGDKDTLALATLPKGDELEAAEPVPLTELRAMSLAAPALVLLAAGEREREALPPPLLVARGVAVTDINAVALVNAAGLREGEAAAL